MPRTWVSLSGFAALLALVATPAHASTPIGTISACYACQNTGDAIIDAALASHPNVASDGILFAFKNTSNFAITGGVFSVSGTSPGDSFRMPTIPAGGEIILIPGITSDGASHPSGGLFEATGFKDTSDGDGGVDDTSIFRFTGTSNGVAVTSPTAGSSTAVAGTFTPGDPGLIKPWISPSGGRTSFVGDGPDGDAGCTNCYFGVVATLTAASPTQYQLTLAASPVAGGTVTPVSGGLYDSGTVVAISAKAAAGYQFSGWTGPVSNAASPSTTVTMSAPRSVTAGFSLNSLSSGLGFYPVAPCRVADTRAGMGMTGAFGPPSMAGQSTRSFPVPLSACNVPAGAQAYSLNVTVVPPAPLIYLSIWPAGQPQPLVSTLNSFDGAVVANAALVPAGTDGAISVFVSDASDVIIDINGYFAPPNAQSLAFYPLPPCRIADTRGNGFTVPFGGPQMGAGATRTFPIPSSACNVPAAAQAYSLNMTAVPPGPLIYLTTWPAAQAQPQVSTLNAFDGRVVANAAIVPAGSGGAIDVFVSNASDVVIDINGYFAPPGGSGALYFYAATPCRIADTRGNGFSGAFGPPSLGGQSSRSFAIPNSSCGLPAAARAYSLNMTVVPPGPLIYLTTWPTGVAQPLVSTLNSFQGKVVANAAIVPAGTAGAISVFVSDPTDVIIDVNGYFAQ